MSDPIEHYFRGKLPDWGFVRDEFPFPLAVTCARLLAEMERQEPIAAAWALRDAFECALKFSASLAVADFLHAGPDLQVASEVAQLLLKPSGLSLGDWHTALEMSLKASARAEDLGKSGRVLPALLPVFFEMQGKLRRTILNNSIDGNPGSFVAWRNRVFGHGVFSQDRGYYAQETLAWLPVLGDFYAALRPVLADRRLVSRTPGGEEIVWHGTGDLPPVARHEHEPWGDPLPMLLAPAPGLDLPELPLTPFLSVQQCQSCGQPAAFFFDKNKYDRKQDRHSTAFLEYFSGHPGTHKDWSETRRLAEFVPPTFNWERGPYGKKEGEESQRIIFRDFDAEYMRPDYLLDAVWRITEEQTKGYIHLVGPGGMGKTYFMRGLTAEGPEYGACVLSYHILPGARTDIGAFLTELEASAHAALDCPPNDKIKRQGTTAQVQEDFASYLKLLKQANCPLIVAIDALDELADPAERSLGITDYLPSPDLLPDGCFFVLTSREELRPKVRADIARLQAAAPDAYTAYILGTDKPANGNLLRAYLTKHLPAPYQAPGALDAVLARSGGVFLYAFHLCRALEAGVFPDVAALPDGAQFYPAYLERLRARVGDHLYSTVYLPTLMLLCAAMQPVTLGQLASWGVPHDRLQFALLDLRDFLRGHRELPWQDRLGDPDGENRYEMAHEAFIRFVLEDPELTLRLRDAHGAIARHALAEHGRDWKAADPTETADLYDLRCLLPHLEQANMMADAPARLREAGYDSACFSAAGRADDSTHFHVAVILFNSAVAIHRSLVASGRTELADDLARALGNKGNVLSRLGRLAEALVCHDEAVALYQSLVDGGRTELADNLAGALTNKGNDLGSLGRLAEALVCQDESIALYQSLVASGRTELADDLALALGNKGNDLSRLGRLPEALVCYDEAIAIRRSLVASGRTELADRLAGALVNKGNVLSRLGRLAEALACYDEAIVLYQGLVESGRTELEDRLASTLRRRGRALSRRLYAAAARGDVTFLTFLITDQPERVHLRDHKGWTALHWAARHGQKEAVLLLLEYGADVNAPQEQSSETDTEDERRLKEKDGRTPLHSAAYGGHREIVSLLLEHGADRTLRDLYGQRPIDIATDAEIIALLSESHE